MIDWYVIVIGLSVLLLVFLWWKEISRRNKARLFLRLAATLVSVISLACMCLPVNCNRTISINYANEAILLTEGFSQDSLARFLRLHKNIPVFTLDERLASAMNSPALLVTDRDVLAGKNIHAMHVFGYGLSRDELAWLPKQTLIFHPSKMVTGITSIYWRSAITTGEKWYIQGRFNNASSTPKK